MKNRKGVLIAIRWLAMASLSLMVPLVTGFGISCTSQAPPSSETADVNIEDLAFNPAEINVPVGSTVTWFNKDSVIHTVTAREGTFDSGNLSRNETFSHTFEERGTFEYYCTIHPYIEGRVVVE